MSSLINILLGYSVFVFAISIAKQDSVDCTDLTAAFPIDMDDTHCQGLYNVSSATTYEACAQVCCEQVGCEVYQFCPQNAGCGTANSCLIGSNSYCTYHAGWKSRARSEPPTSHIWPLPQSYSLSSSPVYYIDQSHFSITANSESSIVENAIKRYNGLIFPHSAENDNFPDQSKVLKTLKIVIQEPTNTELQLNTDESYQLYVPDTKNSLPSQVLLESKTIFGALRALETFSQLVIFNFTQRYYNTYGCSIADFPRFSHRGLLIDSSRHFLSVSSIRTVLDAMSYAKLNVLHWHVVDMQSFPFESLSYPYLWKGSYTKYERYLQSDVEEIITYATDRGIRVIPEFDIPGHANSWCYGYPEICPSMSCQSPLNPAVNITWNLLQSLIAEVSLLFPDDMIHLGGDEVNTKCWSNTASIKQWMNLNHFDATQALQYFNAKAIDIGVSNKKTVIQWDEVFTLFDGVWTKDFNPSNAIVEVWHKDPSLVQRVVNSSFRCIVAPDPTWYLDHLNVNWETEYMHEPLNGITDPKLQQLVIGGEGCMWGETVDVSDIEQTIWPRMAAIAERLWSARSVNDAKFALPRISYFRCLLDARNIAAALINAPLGREAPPRPGSCYELYAQLTNTQ